ncbi:NYN domain-containing protein [Candidatus Rhabdochlamydia porcellionis]|jgi:predicted RNA-binding protein with PIN domain|uniref:YacP-like NYN domain n=1 Tax=Candidatus Rhabdochlamydia porcellionis TaxID=225148 RepID=A0ABX8Z5Y5_9BACT|nr:NYN domain-containing protein [Candidatus Rhabdochlamydia porcellionis]QZA59437.1 YacP-like NYN domain [Candidatus Rhabdochlamydia porcellionis]
MRYFVDGYNLLFYLTKKHNPLRQYRYELISYFATSISSFLDIVLVFDGSDPHEKHSTKHHIGPIEIIYTPLNMTADFYIFEEIQLHKNPAHTTVVSNDQELIIRCRALGAKTLSLTDFLSYVTKKNEKQKKSTETPIQETPQEISRLLKIFENKLKE